MNELTMSEKNKKRRKINHERLYGAPEERPAVAMPDRIWVDGCAEHSWFPDDGTEVYQTDTLYIRKGAFPVEEIRAALDDRSLQGMAAIRVQLRRILSLLESNDE